MEQLLEAQHMIVTEQQEVSYKAAHSTPSLNRLQQRLIVMERVFIALANRYSILLMWREFQVMNIILYLPSWNHNSSLAPPIWLFLVIKTVPTIIYIIL